MELNRIDMLKRGRKEIKRVKIQRSKRGQIGIKESKREYKK